jgi:hypothetical protein
MLHLEQNFAFSSFNCPHLFDGSPRGRDRQTHPFLPSDETLALPSAEALASVSVGCAEALEAANVARTAVGTIGGLAFKAAPRGADFVAASTVGPLLPRPFPLACFSPRASARRCFLDAIITFERILPIHLVVFLMKPFITLYLPLHFGCTSFQRLLPYVGS